MGLWGFEVMRLYGKHYNKQCKNVKPISVAIVKLVLVNLTKDYLLVPLL